MKSGTPGPRVPLFRPPNDWFNSAYQENVRCGAEPEHEADHCECVGELARISNNEASKPRGYDASEISDGILHPAPASGGGGSGEGLRDEPGMGTVATKRDTRKDENRKRRILALDEGYADHDDGAD